MPWSRSIAAACVLVGRSVRGSAIDVAVIVDEVVKGQVVDGGLPAAHAEHAQREQRGAARRGVGRSLYCTRDHAHCTR
jgi:hypothetical protein